MAARQRCAAWTVGPAHANDPANMDETEAMPQDDTSRTDAGRAIRFLILKAAIFIGVPVLASIAAVLTMLK